MAIGPSTKGGIPSYLLSKLPMVSAIGLALAIPAATNAAEGGRQLEEVVVTAERQEASVQDTSISITAFTSEMLEDFGIKDQTDLQNFVPATIILPYDASVRGVGRNFRSLGGDPGISTYINGVYSEDLYTATIQSFWDLERIEILRGPQGTLYGRNAVGGAMNFIHNRPTQETDYRFKALVGNYDAREMYGMVNGSLIEDQLSGRFTFHNRERDGYIKEMNPLGGPDLDSRNEENYAGQLNWTPTDTLEFNVRANRLNVYRVMGGADGGGLVVFRGEDEYAGLTRDFSNAWHGFRPVDPNQTDPLATDYLNPSQPLSEFINPATGATILAQKNRTGIDANGNILPNYGYDPTGNYSQAEDACVITDKENIDGDDLCAYTNGNNYERFHQQGVQFDMNWDVNDSLAIKYIYGYNKLSYHRVTDDDATANQYWDRQFYVNHEATYKSHEIQAFYDINDSLSFTSGFFIYDAVITQRGDFFDSVNGGQNSWFYTGATDPVGANLDSILGWQSGPIGLWDAQNAYRAGGGGDTPTGQDNNNVQLAVMRGDTGGIQVEHGISSPATDLLYTTRTIRDSMAIYTQGVWDINDDLTLTFGIRWAEDELRGEENLYRYSTLCNLSAGAICGLTEVFIQALSIPYAIDPRSQFYSQAKADGGIATNLAEYNVALGALDPVTLEATGNAIPLQGIPLALSVFRSNERTDDEITYRLNLDWNIDDSQMMYFSVTTGYRGGGYNLVFFSNTMTYDPEELIAYEIGYKSQLLDNTLQLNASTYLYDYSTIHTFGAEATQIGGTTTSVLEAPGARIYGFELELLWLATDRITIGGNYSYTPSEYTEQLLITDDNDPRYPSGLMDVTERTQGIKGNQVLNVAENKGSMFGTYSLPLGDNGQVNFSMSASWIDDSFNSQFETEFDRAPGYERYDFRTTWTSANEQWVVSGFVNNILNEVGIRQIEGHGEDEGYRRTGMVTEPRMYGVEVTYSMGN